MILPTLLTLFLADLALSACTRSALQGTFDGFFQSAFAASSGKGPLPLRLSPTVKITQNNQIVENVESSAWGNSTSFYRKWRITAIDTETCNIAAYVMLNQRTSPTTASVPAILGIRIRIGDDSSTQIREIELLNILDGGPGILRGMFRPDNNETYSDSTQAYWESPQKANLTRAELVRIANTYPDGIQAGDGKNIPVGGECSRWENGVQTAGGTKIFKNTTQPRFCRDGLDEFKQPVEFRRWVADTETGVVLGLFYFSHRKEPLTDKFDMEWGNWLNEFFKIREGKMVGVHAIMLFVRDKKDVSSGVSKSEWKSVW
jgi:hypothetical protein